MTKKINSFWVSEQPPVDDLDAIQEYLKPRGHQELLEYFSPSPPGVEEPQEVLQQLDSLDALRDELLEHYGITPEEFAQSAIDEPELWDEDELERLQAVLAGELEPKAIADLAHEYSTGGRKASPKVQAPRDEAPLFSDDFFEDRLEPPTGVSSGEIDVSVPMGAVDVGEWWTKTKK